MGWVAGWQYRDQYHPEYIEVFQHYNAANTFLRTELEWQAVDFTSDDARGDEALAAAKVLHESLGSWHGKEYRVEVGEYVYFISKENEPIVINDKTGEGR